MSTANDRQVGGVHYNSKIQHWDYVVANDLDYFQAQITKYVTRHKKKNGLQDLKKAQHFLEKYIEVETRRKAWDDDGEPTSAYVNQGGDEVLSSAGLRRREQENAGMSDKEFA